MYCMFVWYYMYISIVNPYHAYLVCPIDYSCAAVLVIHIFVCLSHWLQLCCCTCYSHLVCTSWLLCNWNVWFMYAWNYLWQYIHYFYASRMEFDPVFVLSVCVCVCPSVAKKFNLNHNFWTVINIDFIFGIHTQLMKPFQMAPNSMTLWPWLWPLN